MSTAQIAYATHKSRRLVREYEKIIDEHAEKSYVLEHLLKYEPHLENNIEQWANVYGRGTRNEQPLVKSPDRSSALICGRRTDLVSHAE